MDDIREALIREAFSKIKEEMSALSIRLDGVNDNIMSLKDDLSETRIYSASKDMVTGMQKDMIELNNRVYHKDVIDKAVGTLEDDLGNLKDIVDKREKLLEDVKEIRKLRKDLDTANDRFIPKTELKNLFDKLNEDLLFLDKRLTEMQSESFSMDEVESGFATKKEFKDTLSAQSESVKKQMLLMSDKLRKMDDMLTVSDEKKANAAQLAKLQDEVAELRPQMADSDDLDELNEKIDGITESQKKESAKALASLDKRVSQTNERLARISEDLSELFMIVDKSASKDSLELVRKQVSVLADAAQDTKKVQKELSLLKREHAGTKRAAASIEKKLKRK